MISLLSRKLPVPSGSQMKLFLPVILIQYRFLKEKKSKPQLICYAIIILINTARMSEEFSNISSHSFRYKCWQSSFHLNRLLFISHLNFLFFLMHTPLNLFLNQVGQPIVLVMLDYWNITNSRVSSNVQVTYILFPCFSQCTNDVYIGLGFFCSSV